MFTSRRDLVLLRLAGALMLCGSSPAAAEPVAGVDRACHHGFISCENDCNNGNSIPLGSSQSAIDSCGSKCVKRYDRCNGVFRPGRSDPPLHRTPQNTHVPVRNTGGGVLQPLSNSQPTVHTSGSGGAVRHK
jgi:hypothetical protein